MTADRFRRLSLQQLETRDVPAVFTVTTTADTGAGSLRQAIIDANAASGTDTIRFQIGSGKQTIAVASALPAITDAVTIDGGTQTGYTGTPLVVLDGAATPVGTSGLILWGTTGSTVRGLQIINFSKDFTGTFVDAAGINIRGGSGNTIQGNYLGTDGTTAKPNGYAGVLINDSANNLIGGLTAAARNVISGNVDAGVYVANPLSTGNTVQGNYIGTDATGTHALPNGAAATSIGGVVIAGFGAGGVVPIGNNTIGGTAAGAGNLIAFERYAVQVVGSAGNPIEGNSMHDNGAGILLDSSFHANDTLDVDVGANNLQNQPTITATTPVRDVGGSVTNTTVTGTLNSTPNTQFRIEVYRSTASGADSAGNGQGQVLIGFVTVTTDATGTASFSVTTPPVSGQYVVASATNVSTGDSSPFSKPVLATVSTGGKGYAVGAMSGEPRVWLYNANGTLLRTFLAYDKSVSGGVHVATADFNGDGVLDVVTAPGTGFAPHVRVFDGKTGVIINEFYAYAPTFSGGVSVAAADLNGDSVPDIVTGAGPGGAPHVKAFDVKHAQIIASFFAYDTGFHGGVNVAAGDVTGDGFGDIITGAAAGGGPHLRVWSKGQVVAETFAFDPRYNGGLAVAVGDFNNDGKADIAVAPQTGGPSRVRVLSVSLNVLKDLVISQDSYRGGTALAMRDTDGDGAAEVIVSMRNNGRPQVLDVRATGNPTNLLTPDPAAPEGVYVG